MKTIFRIGFFIGDSRKFDFYDNVINHLDPEVCDLVINDFRMKDKKEVEKMITIAKSRRHAYRLGSDLIRKKEIYQILVGVGNYGIPRNNIRPRDLLIYLYAKTAGTVLESTGLSKLSERFIRRPMTAGGKSAKLYNELFLAGPDSGWKKILKRVGRISPESLVGKYRVLFPRGMDVSPDYPGDYRIRDFHIFFCHGVKDRKIVDLNTGKPTHLVGYPRYDNLAEWDGDRLQMLKMEFGIGSDKPVVLWLTSSLEWTEDRDSNITLWFDAIRELRDDFEVIFRPHPTRLRANPELIRTIEDAGVRIDRSSARDMTGLYALADFVISDYGGTVFSSLYCDKNILLLNHPEESKRVDRESLDLKIRKSMRSLDLGPDKRELHNILSDSDYWKGQKIQRRVLRKHFFGGAPVGEGARKAAALLSGFLQDSPGWKM